MQIRAFCTTGDIHNNNLQGGGGQFNDSIKQRMNIVVALHGKTCFVIAPAILFVCFDMTARDALSLFSRRT
jgi:hypothetical protein